MKQRPNQNKMIGQPKEIKKDKRYIKKNRGLKNVINDEKQS